MRDSARRSNARVTTIATLGDLTLESGEVLGRPEVAYDTWGEFTGDNAVLILHGTGGEGGNFLRQRDGSDSFGGELFGPGQLLDATRHFIVLPDGIGHGRSSRPSDGLKGKFPRYGYRDMVAAQHRLLTEPRRALRQVALPKFVYRLLKARLRGHVLRTVDPAG